MENNSRGTNIFLGVIGVATLIVAIIGATFAFFGAEITGGEGNLGVQSTTLALGYSDETTRLKRNLIPAEYWIADYAARTQYILDEAEYNALKAKDPALDTKYVDSDGKKLNYQCMDDNGNEICGVYTFTIGNPSTTTAQTIYATVNVVANGFSDLFFRIYDEEGNQVVAPTRFAAEGGKNALPTLTQTLLPTAGVIDESKDEGKITTTNPLNYTLATKTLEDGTEQYNRRTYTMIIWIEETKTNQTLTNAGMTFAGSIYFTTASGDSGVTGIIHAAQQGSNPDNPAEPAA